MAKFFLHGGGICLRANDDEERRHPVPAGATDIVVFDEAKNDGVIAAFATDYNSFSLSGGVLRRNGTPVTFAADGEKRQDSSAFNAALSQYLADLNAYLSIADSATNAQVRTQAKLLTQGMIRVVRIVKHLSQ